MEEEPHLKQRNEFSHSKNVFDSEFQSENSIKITRSIIRDMSEEERFYKAKAHILDSLNYRKIRPLSESKTTSYSFRMLYKWRYSTVWQWLLISISTIFMYLVMVGEESFAQKVGIEGSILLILWVDTFIKRYIEKHDLIGSKKKVNIIGTRTIILFLLTIDLLIFIGTSDAFNRQLQPFRILRAFLPLIYEARLKRMFLSMASAYTDILVYVIFLMTVISGWALIGNRTLVFDPSFQDPYNPTTVDPYASNYSSLGKMVYMMYVLMTFDGFPDNEIITVQNYQPNYLFFVVYILFNMFLVGTIPGTLVYNKYRKTQSRLTFLEELRQQHSLILAFVTLAEEKTNLQISSLIDFLNYFYMYKIRYIEHVTELCLKLDKNNNRSIQVNQFMRLSQIILENSVMKPPTFRDIECWVSFRIFMNRNLKLKTIVSHWLFQLIITIIIILSVINALYFSFTPDSQLIRIFDHIFIWIFTVQLLMRIIGIGPEYFFQDRWNNVDTFLVIIQIFFFFFHISDSLSSIAQVARVFRIASFFRVLSHSNFMKGVKIGYLQQLKLIYQVLLEIMLIILGFIPLLLFTFYFFTILGMEFFFDFYQTNGSPNYNTYEQYSSFRTFIQSHFVMVQILTQAGWSTIAYDHCWRRPQYYGYIMLFFCFMHLIIVYIISAMIKGVFWQVYFTVDQIFKQRDTLIKFTDMKEKQNQERTREIKQINDDITDNKQIDPNTILKRQLYENSLDRKIFMRLKKDWEEIERGKTSKKVITRKMQIEGIISQFNIPLEEIQNSTDKKQRSLKINSNNHIYSQKQLFRRSKIPLNEIQEYSEEDFQSQIENLFHRVLVNPRMKFSHVVVSGPAFNQFLKEKFKTPDQCMSQKEFDLNKNPLSSKDSIDWHVGEIRSLLNIQTSKREQKAAIIKSLYERKIINQENAEAILKSKLFEKVFKVDTNGTLRKLYLSETSQELIRKFQVEYFSQLYGVSFKEINKMTLGPLLKVEATLTYSLRNIMRYPMIDNTEFFEMITHIEDQYSNQVLKKGSLFKFVYKLEQDDTWFSVEFKRQQEMRVHFVKTGVWCYTPDMQDNQVYYARDAFRWDLEGHQDRATCQKTMKRFYESFEGLAFSLLKEDIFFKSNPKKYVYDLYVQSFDAEKLKRFKRQDHEISKVMVVILSKEELREELGQPDLPYELSDLVLPPEKPISLEFSFDDSENDVYQQLKNVSAADHEKIVQSQGLPFSYTLNLMNELQDTFRSYGHHFAYQIEKVYNDQFSIITQKQQQPLPWSQASIEQRDAHECLIHFRQDID